MVRGICLAPPAAKLPNEGRLYGSAANAAAYAATLRRGETPPDWVAAYLRDRDAASEQRRALKRAPSAKPRIDTKALQRAVAAPQTPTVAVEALVKRQAEDRKRLRDREAGKTADQLRQLEDEHSVRVREIDQQLEARLETARGRQRTAARQEHDDRLAQAREQHEDALDALALRRDREEAAAYEELASRHARELTGGGATVEVRQADILPTLSGYVNLFGSLSVDLGGFRERIMPGAFRRSLEAAAKGEHDILAYVEHDGRLLTGRTSAGNLRLEEDAKGLRFWLEPVDTSVGRDLTQLVRAGVVKGMSFGFTLGKERWTGGKASSVREVSDLTLYEVSAVGSPAYPRSSIGTRWRRSLSEAEERSWWQVAHLRALSGIENREAGAEAERRSVKGGYQWR